MGKNDHGENPNSTVFIYDLLSENNDALSNDNDIADELLPPDSPKRKKREARKFYEEMCYIVMIESIRIHEDYILFMQQEMERIEMEPLFEIKDPQKEINTTQQLMNQYQLASTHLTEEQALWLQAIKFKFNHILSYLDNEINVLNQTISIKYQKIEALEKQLQINRQYLANTWINHFLNQIDDPDFTPLRINIRLHEKFKHISTDDRFKDHLELGKDVFKHIGYKIGDELRTGETTQHTINRSLNQKIEQHIEDHLNKHLSFVPTDEKQEIIQDLLQKDKIQNSVSSHLMQDVSTDKEFRRAVDNELKISQEQAEERTKLEACKKCLEGAMDLQSVIMNQFNNLNKLESIPSYIESNVAPDPGLKRQLDLRLDMFDQLGDDFLTQTGSLFSALDNTLAQLDTTSLNTNNLQETLSEFTSAAKSTKSGDYLQQDTILNEINSVLGKAEGLLGTHAQVNQQDYHSPVKDIKNPDEESLQIEPSLKHK